MTGFEVTSAPCPGANQFAVEYACAPVPAAAAAAAVAAQELAHSRALRAYPGGDDLDDGDDLDNEALLGNFTGGNLTGHPGDNITVDPRW